MACGECDIVGLGPSAISRIGDSYSQSIRDLAGYTLAVDAGHLPVACGIALSRDDRLRREAIGALMCHGELDTGAFAQRHGIDFARYFAATLSRLHALEHDGLVALADDHIRVTPAGRLLLRHVAMSFDAYPSGGSKLI